MAPDPSTAARASLSWGFAAVVAAGASALAVVVALALPAAALPGTTVVVTGVSTLVLFAAAARIPGRTRLSWGLVASAALLWSASLVGAVLGWPADVVWWWLRVPAYALASAGILTSPGVRRSLPEWGVTLLDGVLFAAATAGLAWFVLGRSDEVSTDALRGIPPALLWVPADVAALSLIVGLGLRASPERRPQAALVVTATVGTVLADTAWALTGQFRFGVAGWLAVVTTLAAAGCGRRLDMWVSEPETHRLLQVGRLSQGAAVPILATAVLAPPDPVLVSTSLVVLAALALQLFVLHRQNGRLWRAVVVQARRLDDLVTDSRDALVQVDGDGVVVFASDAVHDVFGVTPAQMAGRHVTDWLAPDDPLRENGIEVLAPLLDGSARRVVVHGTGRHADGTWRHTESVVSLRDGGAVPGFTISCRDTTEAEALAAEVRRRARTDSLTGLLSRSAFLGMVDERLAAGAACVLFVDLDGFKDVNDTSGHAAGDRLLRDVAAALAGAVGEGDVVARLGGDEFAVLVAGGTVHEGLDVAAAVLDALSGTGRTRETRSHGVGASIGVAAGPAADAEALLGHADLAMYEAKAAGGGRTVAFEPAMRTRILHRARIVAELDEALAGPGDVRAAGTGLDLHLQPIVRLPDGAWTGYEALLRWTTPDGQRPPDDFVPIAEETGRIVGVGAWVLRRALRWLADGGDPVAGVSVNVASRQLADPAFTDLVLRTLEQTGVDPSRLTLEVTEGTAVDDLTRTGARLQTLRAAGVHVSLDDFGTGFSSLGYLARLPVDELKIDRRFVAGLGVRTEDDVLVRAVLRLAGDLGLGVVAEGVETAEQAALLTALGCPRAQGWWFCRPAPASALRPGESRTGPREASLPA